MSRPTKLPRDPAVSLSPIPGQQEEGKKSRASVLSHTCHFSLCLTDKIKLSHWPQLVASRVAGEYSPQTRQPCPQLEPGAERAVVLLLKERERGSRELLSSLRTSHSDSRAGTPTLPVLFTHSTGFVSHRHHPHRSGK